MDEKAKPNPAPEWRRRRDAQPRPNYIGWWAKRHHCSDVVLGERHEPPARAEPPDTKGSDDIPLLENDNI